MRLNVGEHAAALSDTSTDESDAEGAAGLPEEVAGLLRTVRTSPVPHSHSNVLKLFRIHCCMHGMIAEYSMCCENSQGIGLPAPHGTHTAFAAMLSDAQQRFTVHAR